MRSEIPQIQVITAITEAESEDYIAQLLYSQGWSIIHRAFDADMLTEFLNSRPPELRTVIVYKSDFEGFSQDLIDKYESSTFSFICLDNLPVQAHAIMSHIRSQLRLPMLHNLATPANEKSLPQIEKSKPKCVIVTGTANAPGRTTIALALAHAGVGEGVTLRFIDADLRSTPLASVLPESEINFPLYRPEAQDSYQQESVTTIADIGSLQPLTEVVNDRRWSARYTNELFESATSILYICKDNKRSLIQLSGFVKELPVLLTKIPITYICITSTQGKEYRVMSEAFRKIIGTHDGVLIRENTLHQGNTLLGSSPTRSKKVNKEIGSIATSVL